MNYPAFIIRKKRLEKNWSQDGLCQGICTASYLSKIEQGKTVPSAEILVLLFERLGIAWNDEADGRGEKEIQEAYDLLFSDEKELLRKKTQSEAFRQCENSPWGLDYLLLTRCAAWGEPLEKELETLMDTRQTALQRLLQHQEEAALLLYPCAFLFYEAGVSCYIAGSYAQAIEYLYRANSLASDEGRARIMLNARAIIGSCYANLRDLDSMERHFAVARRLARTLGDTETMTTMDYNWAATCIETGNYREALDYFQTQKDSDSRIVLHKLAICLEHLGQGEQAMEVLERAAHLPDDSPEKAESEMCRVVQIRLENPQYLDSADYGEALLRTFSLCRKYLPTGFSLFHMPWMIEWYEHHRQYKQAAALLQEFPEFRKNAGVKEK